MAARSAAAATRAAPRSSHALLLLAVLLWSTNFATVKAGLDHGFSPLAFNAVRWLLVAALVSALVLATEGSLRVARRDVPLVAGLAAVLFALNQVFAMYALELGAASTTAIVFGLMPLFVAALAHGAGIERLGRRFWAATSASLFGVVLLVAGAGGVSADAGGVALAVVNVGSFAAYIVCVTPLLGRYSVLRVTALSLVSASLMLAAVGSVQLAGESWGSLDGVAWSAVVWATASVLVANVVWLEGGRHLGPSRAALYSNLLPLLGAVIAVVALGERPAGLQVAGGVLILVALAVVARVSREAAPDA